MSTCDTCEGCKFSKVVHVAEFNDQKTIMRSEFYGLFFLRERKVEVKNPWDFSHEAYDKHMCYAEPHPVQRTTTKPGEFPPACTKKQT